MPFKSNPARVGMTPVIPELPLETVEHIAAFLWNDTKTLIQCTLVCQTWHTAVRPYIFRRVIVRSQERLKQLEVLLESCQTVGYWIRELRIDGGSAITKLASSGRIYESEFIRSSWVFQFSNANSDTSSGFPGQILPEKLKKLYALTFVNVRTPTDLNTTGAFIRNVSRSFAGSVRSLAFISCAGHDGFFLAFRRVFPFLNDLQLVEVQGFVGHIRGGTGAQVVNVESWMAELELPDQVTTTTTTTTATTTNTTNAFRASPTPDMRTKSLGSRLVSVRMDDHEFVKDVRKFLDVRSLRTVQTLEIRHTGFLHAMDEIAQRILPECGRALRTLKIAIAWLPEPSSMVRYQLFWMPALTHLKELRVLELDMKPLHHPFILLLLDTIRGWCGKIAKIIFHVSFVSRKGLVPVDLMVLDGRLGSFRSLKEVCFKYDGPLEMETVRGCLGEAFPHLQSSPDVDSRVRMCIDMQT